MFWVSTLRRFYMREVWRKVLWKNGLILISNTNDLSIWLDQIIMYVEGIDISFLSFPSPWVWLVGLLAHDLFGDIGLEDSSIISFGYAFLLSRRSVFDEIIRASNILWGIFQELSRFWMFVQGELESTFTNTFSLLLLFALFFLFKRAVSVIFLLFSTTSSSFHLCCSSNQPKNLQLEQDPL